jgi:hypothetical protein
MGYTPKHIGLGYADDVLFTLSAGSLKTNRAALLEYMTFFTEVAKLPIEEQGQHQESLERMYKDLPTLARSLCFFHDALIQHYRLSRAELRCAATMLAVERFRLTQGRWPVSLQDTIPKLLGKVPTDPYASKPLHYKRLLGGCMVYSVGPDGQDNEGNLSNTFSTMKIPPGTDIGFRLWDVAARRQPADATRAGKN